MSYNQRRESKSEIYHVMIRGINHEKIFKNEMDKHVIRGLLLKKMKDSKVKIFAYCIMDTHLHLLIKSPIDELSKFMARAENAYARYYNASRCRNGHVFQNRFKSECVEDSSYFYCCMKYIHNNPIKAELCQKPEQYKFSSLHEIVNKRFFLLCEKTALDLQKDKETYHELFLFADTPEDHIQQCYDILKALIEKVIKIYNLYSFYEILENENAFNLLSNEFWKITRMGKNTIKSFVFEWMKNSA